MLSIALLFASNLNFHIHSLDHGPGPLTHHDSVAAAIDLAHDDVSIKHLSIDTSHADHHHAVIVEMDASPDSLAGKSQHSLSAMDVTGLLLLPGILAAYLAFRPDPERRAERPSARRFHLIPLLRAPPV